MLFRWSKQSIIVAIQQEAAAGHELSYTRVEKRVPSLLRAAQRFFGSWAEAVEAAGFDYSSIRKYRKWSKSRVIKRIQELHTAGHDLSWRNISQELDPPLAAAALQANRFCTWNEALTAAGLNPNKIMRYQKWSTKRVRESLRELALNGAPLDRDSLAESVGATLAAVYRVGDGLVAERTVVLQQLKDEGYLLPYPTDFYDKLDGAYGVDGDGGAIAAQI